jgi:[ribosomal protein S18]-alanine N-acetyltransferase
MNVKIETATIELLEKLYEIEKQSFQNEAFSKRQIGCLLKDFNSITLVARVSDEIVAFAIGRIEHEARKVYGHVFTLETVPSYRRKGIAQELLKALEKMFVERGAVESRLEVREDNLFALSLYQKLGYKQVKRIVGYYGNAPGLHFKKKLDSL